MILAGLVAFLQSKKAVFFCELSSCLGVAVAAAGDAFFFSPAGLRVGEMETCVFKIPV